MLTEREKNILIEKYEDLLIEYQFNFKINGLERNEMMKEYKKRLNRLVEK